MFIGIIGKLLSWILLQCVECFTIVALAVRLIVVITCCYVTIVTSTVVIVAVI